MGAPKNEEIVLLDQLRERIADMELGEEDSSYKNLVRYLRARNGNVAAAETMIRNNREWQASEDVKGLLWDFEYPKNWDDDFYYAMTGFDREGNPFFVAPFGKWDMQKEMAKGNKEEFIKYIYHHMERLWGMVKQMCKGMDHMYQAVAIVDLEGLSLRQVTSLDVVEAAIRCIRTFEANHPETVKAAIVINAPWAFQLIWKLIKPFISEHTHGKLNFVGSDKEKWREAILKYAEPDQCPECYGGTCPNDRRFHIARDGSFKLSENENESDDDYKTDYEEPSNQIIAL